MLGGEGPGSKMEWLLGKDATIIVALSPGRDRFA